MSVFRKKMPNGKQSPTYHYRFQVDGKRYAGSTGCITKRDADRYEREVIDKLRVETSAKAVVEKFRDHLAGGKSIAIADAWEEFAVFPRRFTMSPARAKATESRWQDFVAFMADRHPDSTRMCDVKAGMAEEYIAHIRSSGRWDKKVSFRRKGKRTGVEYDQKIARMSDATKNDFLATCRLVFKTLARDAGVVEDPFAEIEPIRKGRNGVVKREAFTPEELAKIGKAAEGTWLYPLFLVGITTGLSEGDICTLRWREIDMDNGWIRRTRRKTGAELVIPVLPALRTYLSTLDREGEYIFPDLASRYLSASTRSFIGKSVTKFLEGLKIETTRRVPGRDRAATVKDLHSCRHTFCYLAALNHVPLPVVQNVVGHMSAEMTKHYMDHAQAEETRNALAALPDYLGRPVTEESGQLAARRERVRAFAERATVEELDRMLAALDSGP